MKKTSISRRFRRSCSAIAVAAALAGGPETTALAQEPTSSDIAQARELYNQGLTLRERGDMVAALEKLRAAHALARAPITGLELGRTYVALGRLVDARETFLSNARLAVRGDETPRSKAAREESVALAEQLRSRIPSLLLKITGVAVDSVAVIIDGAAVSREAVGAPRFVDPGRHEIAAISTSGGNAHTTVDVKEGETREVELRIAFTGGTPSAPRPPSGAAGAATEHVVPAPREATAPPHPADTPASTPGSGPGPLGWILVGTGAAVAVAGGVLMGIETGKAKDANDSHDKSAYDAASAAWTGGLVTAIVGGAAVAGGVIVLATGSAKRTEPASQAALWLGVRGNTVRIGGTW